MNANRRRRNNRIARRNNGRAIQRNRRRIRGLRRNVRNMRRRVRRVTRSRIPAAYVPRPSVFFRIVQTTNDTVVVSGRDLVYKSSEEELIPKINNVITVIPSNPAYWQGTRIATIALGYQQFRPLKFHVQYVPAVSTSKSGTIFGGTLWNSVPSEDTLEQTLATSLGRMHTQVYKGATVKVKLGRNLNTNLYCINGQLDVDSNPFYYVAIAKGDFKEDERSQPGLFYVNYTYSFKNPIGQSNTFASPGMIMFKDLVFKPNTTALLCQSIKINKENFSYNLPIFSEIDIDWTEIGQPVCTYNGDAVPLSETDKIWVFQNWNKDAFSGTEELMQRYLLNFTTIQEVDLPNDLNSTILMLGPGRYAVYFTYQNEIVVNFNYDTDSTIDIKGNRIFWFNNNKTYIATGAIGDNEYNQFAETSKLSRIEAGETWLVNRFPNTELRRFLLNNHDAYKDEPIQNRNKNRHSLFAGNDDIYYDDDDVIPEAPKLPKLIPKQQPNLPKLIPKKKYKYQPKDEPNLEYKGENLEKHD